MDRPALPIWKSPWLHAACWALLGSWFTWEHANGYLRTGMGSYMLSTAGWLVFTVAQSAAIYVTASTLGSRLTPRQRLALRLVPFGGLALALAGISMRLMP